MDLVLVKAESIEHFRKRWDQFYRRYKDDDILRRRDELRFLWQSLNPRHSFASMADLFQRTNASELLELDYQNSTAPDRGIRLPQFICEDWLRHESDGIVIDWKKRQIRANPKSLTTFLAVACLRNSPNLKICANSDCPFSRYFIASRKDQKYCSAECAEPARLAAKRKWWNANRGKKQLTTEIRSENVTRKTR
jgi:hypothetical protein